MTTDIAPLEGEYAAEPEAGLGALATSRGNLPLDAVDIRATIGGASAVLAGLVRRLQACDRPGPPSGAELDALVAEAIRLLTGFGAGAGPAARHEFWKRPG
jgi:hypothetical protein